MLKLKNIYSKYGEVEALSGISLEVPKGQVVTILGANGAGKSTTLKTISGLITPVQGEITFKKEDITELEAEEVVARGIVQVPEGRRIFDQLTVKDNLLIGAYTNQNEIDLTEKMKEIFGYFPRLEERKEQLAGTLSGGEQQMLAIGRALMAEPELLLLDEPSLGLAPLVVKDIFSIIEEINDAGTTILIVEQNVRQALKVADYGYVLETGEISLAGSSNELSTKQTVKNSYLGGSQ